MSRRGARRAIADLYTGATSLFAAAPARPLRWSSVGLGTGAVLAGTAVSLLRQPGVGPLDTVWAEDGQIFLSAAVNNGPLDAVATSYAGYYHLVPRLLAQLVSYLPPELAAAGLAIGAAVCTALIALFVFVASGAHLRSTLSRLLVSAVVIVMPLANENSNSPANLHWAGLYAVFWALIWRPRSLAGRVVAAAVVVLVAFSDILVLIYLPLALLRVVRRPPEGGRDRHGLVLAALLAAGVAVQVTGLLTGSSSRHLSPNPVPVAKGYVLRVVPDAMLGERALGTDTHAVRWLALTAVAWLLLAVVAALAWRGSTRPSWPLAGMALVYSVALYALPVTLEGAAIPRYAAAPVMLLVTAMVAALQPRTAPRPDAHRRAAPGLTRSAATRREGGAWRAGAPRERRRAPADSAPLYALAALLAVVWAVNLRVVDNTRADGPRWSAELQQARAACHGTPAGTATLPLPPHEDVPPWRAELPCAYVLR